MPWYTYILFGIYIICCFILIGVVLLQSGKGDIAAAFGGGGSQTAFGPRGAASTLSKVTMSAAIAFMVLSFVFTLPGVLSSGSVAHGIQDTTPATQPAKPVPPAQPLQPAPQQPGAQSKPVTVTIPQGEQKPATTGEKPGEKPAEKAKESPAKPQEKK